MELIGEDALDNSPVVANCRMNREREITGTNSYTRDLHFDILAYLSERIREGREVAWLDLCCGSAPAIAQAARRLGEEHGEHAPVRIDGVDDRREGSSRRLRRRGPGLPGGRARQKADV